MGSRIFASGLLEGQVAVVTGAGSGLGRAIAVELAACGATVVAVGRRPDPLEETAALCDDGRCEPMTCDIREEDEVAALVGGVLERHGRIDVLVNNAGGQFLAPAEDVSPKGFRAVTRLNLEGTWLMTHAVATRAMIPAGGGGVVSVTLTPRNGMPGMVHSGAARAGVENMTRTLSVEWARFGVRLNAVAAGYFDTEVLAKYPRVMREAMAGTVPVQRLGRPEEIAWLVTYLAGPAAAFMTGAVLPLDGGRENWLGPWPPPEMLDEEGRPPAEERRPKD
jgi:citronellol/citronellal dehydrogenase